MSDLFVSVLIGGNVLVLLFQLGIMELYVALFSEEDIAFIFSRFTVLLEAWFNYVNISQRHLVQSVDSHRLL